MATTPFTTAEVQAFRAATQGTAGRIHFNNAGSSLPPDIVVKAMVDYLQEEAIHGGHETETKYRDLLDQTNVLIAKLIHAHPDEIALVENASEAWHIALNGLDFKPGDEVIASEMEYASNVLGLLNAQKRYGIVIRVIHSDAQGNFPLDALEAAITPKTKLMAMTQVPSTGGNVLPVADIGKVARRHNITYLLDACQAVGQMPVDVQAIGCDMIAVTGRKFLRGPRGSGFLYVRRAMLDKMKLVALDGHSVTSVTPQGFTPRDDARRFEWYEKNRGVIMGLNKAIAYVIDADIERIWQRIQHLSATLRQRLKEIDGVVVHDQGDNLCGIVTLSVPSLPATVVKDKLSEKHINVSIGRTKATLYYMNRKGLVEIIRASVHYYNTEEEIDALCSALRAMV